MDPFTIFNETLHAANRNCRLGNSEAAEYLYHAALEYDIGSATVYRLLGKLYSRMPGKRREAIESYQTSFDMKQSARVACAIGDLYLAHHERHEAVRWYHAALAAPESSVNHLILFQLARIYLEWKRPERSRRYLKLAMRCKKNFSKARHLLETLDESFPSLKS